MATFVRGADAGHVELPPGTGWAVLFHPPLAPARPPMTHGMNSAHPRGADLSARGPRFVRCRHVPTVFVCSACGHASAKWHGAVPRLRGVEHARRGGRSPPPPVAGAAGRRGRVAARAVKPVPLAEVEAPRIARLKTGIGELDRVLGGGLVPGSLVLLGGSPGIGKSTLTSMALGNLAGAGRRTLYVSGEESAAQITLRAERLPGAALAGAGASPRPTSTPCSPRSRPSGPRSAWSTRCRRCTRPS